MIRNKTLTEPQCVSVSLLNSEFFKYFNTFCFTLILLITSQSAYADIQVTAIKSGQKELIVYSAPSSSKKTGALPVDKILGLSQGKSLDVLEDAMNSRFLKVNINGDIQWIKAKQVITTQSYDVGSCEKQDDAITGTRAAVNCTNK